VLKGRTREEEIFVEKERGRHVFQKGKLHYKIHNHTECSRQLKE
jgi:hypothetical protein